MQAKQKRPDPVGRDTDRQNKYFNRRLKFSTNKHAESNFESQVKSWAIDRMAENLFQGHNSPQHRLALAFCKKSRGRLLGV